MNEEQATRIATNAIDYQAAQVAERDERIRQLERQCAVLAAEVDRLMLVVDAAIEWKNYALAESDNDELLEAIADYERGKEQSHGR